MNSPDEQGSSDDAGQAERVREPPPNVEGYSLRDVPADWTDTAPVKRVTPVATARPAKRSGRMANFWALMGCNLLVFVASLCIMVLELTAARLVAKHVGNSLYTWTSVIGVVLAGITVGNYIGGWIADRFSPKRALPHLFLMSSMLSFGVLWMDRIAGEIDRPASVAWSTWVLAQVAMVFLLPSISLGTISPVVASLALSRSTKTGMTVGNVYAWGALGSIAGTFLTGFWLIDMFGSKAIVAMTAGVLGGMAAIVASGQRAFRVAVIVGWMQLVCLLGLAASVQVDSLSSWLGGSFLSNVGRGAQTSADEPRPDWQARLLDAGESLRKLGLTLGLRDDVETLYRDESNYSYIEVAADEEGPNAVRYLQLDKLIHSYYDPASPTKLHYEYELVYAEVTERAVPSMAGTTVVPIANFEGRGEVLDGLPAEVRFDADQNALEMQGGMTVRLRDELLNLSPIAEYWRALSELSQRTTTGGAGRLESVALETMPPAASIPKELQVSIVYDSESQLLNAFGPIGDEQLRQLIDSAPQAEYYTAIDRLFRESRKVSTLFLGGGGFVFPRWIESNFPADPLIEVAEIDPAVLYAVQQEMGLPPAEQTAVETYIGDARRFVDAQLRANAALRHRSQPERLYDFVYGDAFNDFSVPWHLTTVEFASKVRQLLNPAGLYMVNIIDIYPRTEYPGRRRGTAEIEFRGVLPEGLVEAGLSPSRWTSARRPFQSLEIRSGSPRVFELRHVGVMSDETLEGLCDVDQAHVAFQNVITDLYDGTNEQIAYDGDLPKALKPKSATKSKWLSCPAPYEFLEVMRLEDGRPVLAVRGSLTGEQRDRLSELAGSNTSLLAAVDSLYERSQSVRSGRFLGRFVKTVTEVFPYVYVYSTFDSQPGEDRDTFVVVSSSRPLELFDSYLTAGHWDGSPFAWLVKDEKTGATVYGGQMPALLELSQGLVLEDDFAPVDNLLAPVFESQ